MCWSNGPEVSWRKKKWSCRNEAGQSNGERLGWGGWGVARTEMCVPQVSAFLQYVLVNCSVIRIQWHIQERRRDRKDIYYISSTKYKNGHGSS